MSKKLKKALIIITVIMVAALLCIYILQTVVVHGNARFVPDYKTVRLDEQTNSKIVFEQTGLGTSAAEKVLDEKGVAGLEAYQQRFFEPVETECVSLFGFLVKKDLIKGASAKENIDPESEVLAIELAEDFPELQPGDILLSLSTHSMGWRHGHAAIYLKEDMVLQAPVIGEDSGIYYMHTWCDFDRYAVMRLKDVTPELQEELMYFAMNDMTEIPYDVFSGYFGEKAPALDDPDLGAHCSYLVWYVYNHFGYDLDSDGGRLVSTYDIMMSPELEVVQIYGLDPAEFKDRL